MLRTSQVIRFIILFCFCVFLVAVGTVVLFFLKSEAKTFELESAPISVLEAHEHIIGVDSMGDEGHHVRAFTDPKVAEEDMWVRGISYKLENAPAYTLHHATVYRTDERDFMCPNERPRQLLSLSQDQAHVENAVFAEGYGLFIPKGTPLVLETMFHNPKEPVGSGETFTDVSLKITFTLASKQEAKKLKPLSYYLLRLSDDPCGDTMHTYTVPPETTGYVFFGTQEENDASRITITEPSRIVYWGAHMHGWEGGRKVVAKVNGNVIEEFETKASDSELHVFDTPHGERSIDLESGDVLSIEAVHDNPAAMPLRGAMGHLAFYITQR